jgi:hypothetical protein
VSVEREIPALLTVEEAGRLLRIGRTKAYAMAREWRETDGRAGLPVVDLGHVLRVPRRALEDLIGAELPDTLHATEEPTVARSLGAASTAYSQEAPPSRPPAPRRSRRHPNRIQNQLDLFKPPADSS